MPLAYFKKILSWNRSRLHGFTPLENIEDNMACQDHQRRIFPLGQFIKKLNSLTGFTLMEALIVVVIIGILAGIAMPSYINTREKTLDSEARSGLGVIRAAELQYLSSMSTFYPAAGSQSNILFINGNLSIALSSVSWVYSLTGGAASFTATATRSGRTWTVTNTVSIPACSPAGACL